MVHPLERVAPDDELGDLSEAGEGVRAQLRDPVAADGQPPEVRGALQGGAGDHVEVVVRYVPGVEEGMNIMSAPPKHPLKIKEGGLFALSTECPIC